MKIVNLYRKQAIEIFTDMRFVTFKPRIDKDTPETFRPAAFGYNYNAMMQSQHRFSKELKQFLREMNISYAWSNSPGVDYSSMITVVIVNSSDYAYIKLMSDEYEITTSYMLPVKTPSYMFMLSDTDYEKYKDELPENKR